MTHHALWTIGPGQVDLRAVAAAVPKDDEIQVRALVSGISRGTEKLVLYGKVPATEMERMRAPFQEGNFPFPVKYGYSMVGTVTEGPKKGRRVFSLYPHQSQFCIPADAALEIPDTVSTERAALAAQMETALNAVWDAAPRIGDRITVVGGGVIGVLTAYLCTRLSRNETVLIDVNPARAELAKALGVQFSSPESAQENCDLIFHASGTGAGLNLAFSLAGFEADVIELSWFGDTPLALNLGGPFHSQRLSLRSSQVGSVAPARRSRWSHRRRLSHALSLCADPRLDALVSAETPFSQIAARFDAVMASADTLCHLIRYQEV